MGQNSTEQKYQRHSIQRVTNVLLATFVLLFSFMITYAYKQLSESETSYKNIANEVVPTLADNGIVHSQLTALAFLISNFAQSTNLPEMRINRDQVNEKIRDIERLLSTEDPLVNDLATIKNEFSALVGSKEQVLSVQVQEQKLVSEIYSFQRENFAGLTTQSQSEIVLLNLKVIQVTQATRLIELRKAERELRQAFSAFKTGNVPLLAGLQRLELLLLSKDGLISLRTVRFRDSARAAGQSNFLRRFVLDIAQDSEFKAYQFAKEQSEIANQFASNSNRSFNIAIALYIVSFVIGLSLILYIKSRVVSRLIELNESLMEYDNQAPTASLLDSYDEIGDLARTINKQFDTIDEQKEELKRISFIDSLTQVANRRAFTERYEQLIAIAKRNELPLSVLLVDVDCFKQYNDEYGHVKGDECLYEVAQAIAGLARRETDFVARYGGEEFACILVGLKNADAYDFAKQVCRSVRSLAIPHRNNDAGENVTVSVGVHTEIIVSESSSERLIQCADTALYQAKTQGKDTAVNYTR